MWYYALDGERQGPAEKDKIQDLIDGGDLGMNSLVWTSGMDDWTPISEVNDFQPSPPPLPQEESSPTSKGSSSTSASELTSSDPPSQTTEESTLGHRAEEEPEDSTKNTGPYAGFGSRLVAYGVDVLIVVVASIILGAIAIYSEPSTDPGSLTQGIGLLIAWFYFAGFESSERQATWGKQLMGLKVTDLNGDVIGFGKATGRNFGKFLSSTILLVGYIMAAFTEKRQALHDMMAGCLVIKESEENDKRLSDVESESQIEERHREVERETVEGTGEIYCERAEKSVDPIPDRRTYGEYTCPSCRQNIQDGRHPPVEEVS